MLIMWPTLLIVNNHQSLPCYTLLRNVKHSANRYLQTHTSDDVDCFHYQQPCYSLASKTCSYTQFQPFIILQRSYSTQQNAYKVLGGMPPDPPSWRTLHVTAHFPFVTIEILESPLYSMILLWFKIVLAESGN